MDKNKTAAGLLILLDKADLETTVEFLRQLAMENTKIV